MLFKDLLAKKQVRHFCLSLRVRFRRANCYRFADSAEANDACGLAGARWVACCQGIDKVVRRERLAQTFGLAGRSSTCRHGVVLEAGQESQIDEMLT